MGSCGRKSTILKFSFIILIDTSQKAFSEEQSPHVMQANPTAGVIIRCLKKETTLEEIYTALEERFHVDHQEMVSDGQEILNQLRAHGALVEE